MGNTGYKSFEILERYYTDDGTSTGETKLNIKTDPDYIAPFLDEIDCPPGARFYNTKQTKTITRNNCGAGYLGSDAILTAYPNQFVSNESVLDANNQAIAWLEANAQIYANNAGTCVLDNVPPSASVLAASSITSNSLKLSWTAATDNLGVVGYEIYQNNIFLAPTTADTIQYDVTGLSPNTSYSYYVKAKDAAGNSSTSNTITATTNAATADTTAPTVPANFWCVPVGSDNVHLEWTPSEDEDSPINYELSRGFYGSFVVLKKNPDTFYSDRVLSNGTYTYRLRAIDPSGNASAYKDVSITINSL
ncbi:DUF5977 domain-containing protein [Flavobacterium sp. KACC 22763]|uniref:DUF5977 domain-containing protein n=1 Tax=Flavobacterium sp. KACC 22763 TaxID=3025668 RepID=UPI0023667659|nr:DUF5977 domain-containing protein [Flavobacterium sp. KACC 22763]WDF64514.1 DUF5977 domain-containing protein [Flavobacterium sp. KACC 22763]